MHPEVQKTSFPQRKGVEMLLEHREHSCTQRYRKHLSNRRRGRNAAGAQRTNTHEPRGTENILPTEERVEMLQEYREHS